MKSCYFASGSSSSSPDSPFVKLRRSKIGVRHRTVAAVMYRPFEASGLETISISRLWTLARRGDGHVAHPSELCADPEMGLDVVGRGLGRHATVIGKAIERLQTDDVKALLDSDKMASVLFEAHQLLPHLRILECCNEGYDGTRRTVEEIGAAVRAVHEWLQRERSPLRGLLSILSAGGLFYSASVTDLTLRGWVQFGNGTLETAKIAAQARGLANRIMTPAALKDLEPTESDSDSRGHCWHDDCPDINYELEWMGQM